MQSLSWANGLRRHNRPITDERSILRTRNCAPFSTSQRRPSHSPTTLPKPTPLPRLPHLAPRAVQPRGLRLVPGADARLVAAGLRGRAAGSLLPPTRPAVARPPTPARGEGKRFAARLCPFAPRRRRGARFKRVLNPLLAFADKLVDNIPAAMIGSSMTPMPGNRPPRVPQAKFVPDTRPLQGRRGDRPPLPAILVIVAITALAWSPFAIEQWSPGAVAAYIPYAKGRSVLDRADLPSHGRAPRRRHRQQADRAASGEKLGARQPAAS